MSDFTYHMVVVKYANANKTVGCNSTQYYFSATVMSKLKSTRIPQSDVKTDLSWEKGNECGSWREDRLWLTEGSQYGAREQSGAPCGHWPLTPGVLRVAPIPFLTSNPPLLSQHCKQISYLYERSR